ncbi:MAG: beta-lactamase family protein [Saprospiraceae bacterium]|nr:beta-lactamase family protein [Saprospiraceae bacterium]
MKISLFLILIITSIQLYGQNDLNKTIDSLLISEFPNDSEPGLTVGVVKDGQIIYHNSRGCMNLEYKLPFNDTTVFGLASVTKQFTAACIGILEKQGKLSVNDDIRKYIPEMAFYGDTIRIKHLLNHTSGIRNHNVLLDLKGFDYAHQGYTNKMIDELMFRQEGVNNLPGEKMLYSNTNYVLLALIVERVSEVGIREFANRELFVPLNMEHTFYRSDLEEIIENRAFPYYKSGEKYKQPKTLTLCVGAGGMGSTIADLAKWSQVFLNPAHKFSFLKEFITQLDSLINGEPMKHGRGMFVSPYKGYTTFNHSGRDLGMRSQFICVPDLNLGIIVYSNSEHINAVNVSYKILDLFVSEPAKTDKEKTAHYPSAKQLNPIIGIYQELNSDLRLTIFIENDTLKALSSFGRDATPLIPENRTVFSRIDNPSITYSFTSMEESESNLQVDFGGAIFYFERIQLEENPNQHLDAYTGSYYSKELDVTYSLNVVDNQLVLNYPNNNNIVLNEGATDVFGANRRTKYSFRRNNNREIISFEVAAEGTVKNILFEKIN